MKVGEVIHTIMDIAQLETLNTSGKYKRVWYMDRT